MANKAKKVNSSTTKKSSVDANALSKRIEELEAENAKLKESTQTYSKQSKRSFWRSSGVIFFVTLSVVSFMLFNIASWAKNTLLDTDAFVSTMQPVLAKPAVQEAITTELTDQLFTSIDIQTELEQALPENVSFLAGPLAGGVENFVSDQISSLLASPQVYDVWGATLTTVHSSLVDYIQDPTNDGVISINDLYAFLGDRVSSDSNVGFLFDKQLPQNIGSFTITEVEWLPEARQYLNTLSTLPIVLIIVSVISMLLAILLSSNKRRIVLTASIISLVLMISTLVAINVGQVVASEQVQPQYSQASEAVYGTITQNLIDRTAGYAALFGLVSLLLIFIAPIGYIASARSYINSKLITAGNKIIPKTQLPDWMYWLPENKVAVIWTVFGLIFVIFGLRIPPDFNQIYSATITATLMSMILYLASITISSTKK
jgi:hypothetical protein